MLDRRSQSPMATSQKMGTARAIFDAGQEIEPTKRLTRSIRNPSNDPLQGNQQQFQYQTGFQASQDLNSQNSRQQTQENFDYRKPETDNFRTVQTYKPQEVSSSPQGQYNFQSFEYKKPDGGRAGSYISAAYNTTFQEPISSQIKTTYEPPKYESIYQKYEVNGFDKYKTTYEQPKTYEKFEPYKFEPNKFEANKFDVQAPVQSSYKSIPLATQAQQPNPSVIQTQYQSFNQDRLTLDTQLNRPTNQETFDYQTSAIPKRVEEPIRVSEIQAKNQIPQPEFVATTTKVQYAPSMHEESVKKEYRPTTPVYTQQQQSTVKQPEYAKQDPIESYKPSFRVDLPKKYVDEIVIIESEANEHEFKAGCEIF